MVAAGFGMASTYVWGDVHFMKRFRCPDSSLLASTLFRPTAGRAPLLPAQVALVEEVLEPQPMFPSQMRDGLMHWQFLLDIARSSPIDGDVCSRPLSWKHELGQQSVHKRLHRP